MEGTHKKYLNMIDIIAEKPILIIFFVIALVLAIIGFVLIYLDKQENQKNQKNKKKRDVSERTNYATGIAHILTEICDSNDLVFRDLKLPYDSNKTTMLDVVIINRNGLFVIRVKSLADDRSVRKVNGQARVLQQLLLERDMYTEIAGLVLEINGESTYSNPQLLKTKQELKDTIHRKAGAGISDELAIKIFTFLNEFQGERMV